MSRLRGPRLRVARLRVARLRVARLRGARLRGALAAVCVALAAAALMGTAGRAHDARPLAVTIVEQAPDIYHVLVRAPSTLAPEQAPSLVWPAACEVRQSAPLAREPGGTSLIACPGGLGGRTIRVVYPDYNPSLSTLFRLEPLKGATRTAVLGPDEPAWNVPAEPDALEVARDYVALGFEHIWSGPDHLLFIAGLVLLARRPRRILTAVTGFTLAHSITLSVATLGIVRLPVPPVEAMIALSILFLAGEVAREERSSFSHRFPIVLSFVFGLLHGFGFASALAEVGLPTSELAVGLVCFNVGVEIGQVSFIAVLGIAFLAWIKGRALWSSGLGWTRLYDAHADRIGAYVLGVPAAFWFLQRAGAAMGG